MNLPVFIKNNFHKEKRTLRGALFSHLRRRHGFFKHSRLYRFFSRPLSLKESLGLAIYAVFLLVIGLILVRQLYGLFGEAEIVKAGTGFIGIHP